MIVAVMAHAEEFPGFGDELLEVRLHIRWHIQGRCAIRRNINFVGGSLAGGQFDHAIKFPEITGESTSVVSETGVKSISSPSCLATGSAVPNFHP